MEEPVALLRSAADALGHVDTLDDIARSALASALRVPGVVRAGLALNRLGGRQLAFVSTDEDRLGPSLQWCLIDAFDRVPLNIAVRTGEDVYVPTAEELDRRFPLIAARQRELGTRSLAALALSTGTERLGVLLLTFGHEQPFDEPVRWQLTSLAALVTQALRRERSQQNRRGTAEEVQRSLLPRSLPHPPGLVVNARYQPGMLTEVAGDWYDVFELPDRSTAFVLGDVAGKGVEAATRMGEVRTAVRAYAVTDPTPSSVLSRLDRFVSVGSGHTELVTCVFGVVSPGRERVTLSVAGHPPPMLVRADDPPHLLRAALGPALGLGVAPGVGDWPDLVVPLRLRDTVFLYSDAVVHGRDVDLVTGTTRLRDALAALPGRRRRPRDLCVEAVASMGGDDVRDDVTVLALARAAEADVRSVVLLPQDPSAAATARHHLRDLLRRCGADEDAVEIAQLCVSELVTNAVMHGGTGTSLSVELDDGLLTVVVEDRGGRGDFDGMPDEDPTRISGRGLALVDALASAWGSDGSPDGTTVWFELELSPASSGSQQPT